MKLIKIAAGIEIVDLALYLRPEKVLVIGDVHLGYEEALAARGVLMPRFQFRDTIGRLEKIFSSIGPGMLEAVVINGDLKHEFARVSEQEWREIIRFIDFLLAHASQVIIVRGQHDVKLSPVARKRGIVVVENIAINEKFVCHGDAIPASGEFKKSKAVIVGDKHPAVSLSEGARSELYKCFLVGKWQDKKLVVMPSFNQVTIGTDILKEQFKSQFVKQGLGSFDIYVAGEETYYFGKVKNLAQDK